MIINNFIYHKNPPLRGRIFVILKVMKRLFGILFFAFIFSLGISPVYSPKAVAAAGPFVGSITASGASSCQVDLNFTAAPGAISYVLQYSVTPASNPKFNQGGVPVPGYDGTVAFFSHTGLNPNTKIAYRYKAIFDGSESDWYESAVVDTGSFSTPNKPDGISGFGYDAGHGVQIDWLPVTFDANGDRGYEVERQKFGDVSWTPAPPLPDSLNSYNDGGLDANFSYDHRVRSFQNDLGCAVGETKKSNWSSISTPTMPTNFSVSYVFGAGNPPVEVDWSASSGANTYKISGTSTINSVSSNLSISDQASTGYTLNNPTDETTYQFSVRGCTTTSCSAPTETKQVIVDNSPNNFVAKIFYIDEATKLAKLSFSWLDNLKNGASEPSYRLEKTSDGATAVFAPTGLSYKSPRTQNGPVEGFENVPLNKNFSYRVKATLSGQDSEFSPAVNLNTEVKYVLRGAAWSGYGSTENPAGLGWVVMNSKGVAGLAADREWSVNIHQDGFLSGVAWAAAKDNSGYGWLSFNKGDLAGCPDDNPAVNCAAKMDLATGRIYGWARFIGLTGTDYEWVSLSDEKIAGGSRTAVVPDRNSAVERLWRLVKSPEGNTFLEKLSSQVGSLFKIAFAAAEVTYGLELNPDLEVNPNKEITGEIWHPELGWIAFTNDNCGEETGINKCLVTAETLNTPPVVSNVLIEEPTLGELGDLNREGDFWCAEVPTYKVSWQYFDEDGDAQSSVKIVLNNATKEVITINRNSGAILPLAGGRYQIITTELGDPLLHPDLGPNTEFSATVEATDARGLVSEGPATSPSVTTTDSAYPLLDVVQDPVPAKINLSIKYTAEAERVNGTPNYTWEFKNGFPATSSKTTETVIFDAVVDDGRAYHLTGIKNGKECGLWGGNVEDGTGKPPRYLEEN